MKSSKAGKEYILYLEVGVNVQQLIITRNNLKVHHRDKNKG